MKISALLTAIENDLTAFFPRSEVRDIAVSPGRFDASEITRRSFRPPALRIAFLGAPRTQPKPDETRRFEAAFAVFIATQGKDRATEGVDLAQAVAERIELNRFSDGNGVGIPSNLRIDALYSGAVDDKGLSLHSVSWTQSLRLGNSTAPGLPSDPAAAIPDDVELDTQIDITQLPEGL